MLRRRFFAHALLLVITTLAWLAGPASAESRLDQVLEKGVLRVGTTGDFKPFTYFNPETQAYEGIDIDAALSMGEALGVEVEFVATTWPTLLDGILQDRYDVAVGGITRTLGRQTKVGITDSYFEVGKCPLVREEDRERLSSIDALNQPSVRVGVNPGGTNEAFVRQHLPRATVTVVPDNLAIPGKVLAGEFDVMMTDNVEAMLFASRMPGLAAVNPHKPFTRDTFGYLTPRDDVAWLAWLNLWIYQAESKGHFSAWRLKWIGEE